MSILSTRAGRGHGSRLARSAAGFTAAAFLSVTGCSAAAAHSGAADTKPVSAGAPSAVHPSSLNGTAGTGSAGTGSPAVATAVPPNPVGPPADPFSGTPADHWADGLAGIVMPKAGPVGGFSTSQVAFAYQWTRRLLGAGFLDKRTLLGGPPASFEKQLSNLDRAWFTARLNAKGLGKDGAPNSTRDIIMSFPPGAAQLIGSVIKVNGTMHAKQVTDKQGLHHLEIDIDYDFVYPIQPPHQAASWMRIVDEVVWTLTFGDWKGATSSFEPVLGIPGNRGGVAGALCGSTDGYQHPDYPNQIGAAQPTVSPSGKPVNPYAMGQSRAAAGCETTTGT